MLQRFKALRLICMLLLPCSPVTNKSRNKYIEKYLRYNCVNFVVTRFSLKIPEKINRSYINSLHKEWNYNRSQILFIQ